MGIKERQDRERLAVRDAILTAARDLFVAEGYGQVSIRKIAERIEYSPAAIYSYFPSKDDIFFALAEEGFQRLDQAIEAVAGAPDPIDDLRRCWWAFYQFSKDQREFFHLMFVDRSVPAISEQWQGFAPAAADAGAGGGANPAGRRRRALPRHARSPAGAARAVGGADRPGGARLHLPAGARPKTPTPWPATSSRPRSPAWPPAPPSPSCPAMPAAPAAGAAAVTSGVRAHDRQSFARRRRGDPVDARLGRLRRRRHAGGRRARRAAGAGQPSTSRP